MKSESAPSTQSGATSSRATLKVTSIMPNLTVNDIQASIAFFQGLGFEIEDRWEQDGTLMGVMLKAGVVRLGLSQDDGKKGQNRTKGVGFRLYIETSDNIDEVAARAKAAGIRLKSEPHDTDWGNRAFEVDEPSGFALTIGSQSSM
jgi:uncharacterized glyoxalase superfamily protein PhnB